MSKNVLRPVELSTRTSATPREVFAALREQDTKSDLAIVERGQYYALVANRPARKAMRPLAIIAALLMLLLILGLTAVTPLFIAALPLTLLPALPYALMRRQELVVAAVADGDLTSVTVDGTAVIELAGEMQAFLAALPGGPSSAEA